MFVFREIWRALFSWNTRFENRSFALLPTSCTIATKLDRNTYNSYQLLLHFSFAAFSSFLTKTPELSVNRFSAFILLKLKFFKTVCLN